MSMTMLTILQIAQALSAYTLVTLILPEIMLHKYLAEYKMSERLIGYFLAGNFYIINVVFILQFLHISNRFTLFCATFVSAFVYMILRNRTKSRQILIKIVDIMSRLARNTMGRRTFFSKCGNHIKSALKKLIIKIKMPLCGCMCDIWFKWHYKLWIYGFRYAGSQLLDKCNV